MSQASVPGDGPVRDADHCEWEGKSEDESRLQPKFHSIPRWRWRWAGGAPGTGIQAFVVLQTQTLNVIRCWLDNDTVRLVFCTYQVAVFTINIMGKTRTHRSVGCVFQRELACVWVHALVPPIIRQHAPTQTHWDSFKEVVFIKSRFFAAQGSVICRCRRLWPAGGKCHLFCCLCNYTSKDVTLFEKIQGNRTPLKGTAHFLLLSCQCCSRMIFIL